MVLSKMLGKRKDIPVLAELQVAVLREVNKPQHIQFSLLGPNDPMMEESPYYVRNGEFALHSPALDAYQHMIEKSKGGNQDVLQRENDVVGIYTPVLEGAISDLEEDDLYRLDRNYGVIVKNNMVVRSLDEPLNFARKKQKTTSLTKKTTVSFSGVTESVPVATKIPILLKKKKASVVRQESSTDQERISILPSTTGSRIVDLNEEYVSSGEEETEEEEVDIECNEEEEEEF